MIRGDASDGLPGIKGIANTIVANAVKREGGKKRDKGNHDKGKLERVTDPDLLFKLKELEILKRIMNMHPTETKKGKGRHSQPGPQKQETSSTTAPTTRKGKRGAAAYMHGYYY